jgi:hypothetical protein
MSSYNPPEENLPTFNPAVFSDNFTPDQVDSKIKTLQTEMDAQQLKTTRIAFDSGANETTITGTKLDVDATLELPNHSDVDTSLTNINTKLTGISFDSATSKTTISNIKTSDDIEITESNINFNRNDGSSASIIQYQSEGLTIKETRGGNETQVIIGGDNIDFKTGASGTSSKLTITSDATPTLNIGVDGSTRGSKIQMEGIAGDSNIIESVIETRSYSGTDDSEMVIFKGNDASDDRIRLRSGKIALDCYTGNTTDLTAENIIATIDSNGLDILLNPIVATGINTGEDTWDIRIPIQCRLAKTITQGSTTNIRLPKAIGNFSAGTNTSMVYLVNISRTDGDWGTGDSPSFLGVLQLSTFATKKGRLYTISGASNDISSIAVATDGDDIDLQVQLSTSSNTHCVITLTQIR